MSRSPQAGAAPAGLAMPEMITASPDKTNTGMIRRPIVRMRIVLREGVVIGPGKADLLAAIDEHGSIAAAGRSMEMSYQRAWSLVDELNRSFRSPLVSRSRGGADRGGAALTAMGRKVLAGYRSIERSAHEHCEAELDELRKLTSKAPSK